MCVLIVDNEATLCQLNGVGRGIVPAQSAKLAQPEVEPCRISRNAAHCKIAMDVVFGRAVEFRAKCEGRSRIEVDRVSSSGAGVVENHASALSTQSSVAWLTNGLDHKLPIAAPLRRKIAAPAAAVSGLEAATAPFAVAAKVFSPARVVPSASDAANNGAAELEANRLALF